MAGVARGILRREDEHADRPMLVELVADMAHEVVQTAVGRGAVAVGVGVTLGERIIDRALAARDIELLDPGVEAAARDLEVARDAVGLAGGLRGEVDRREGVAEFLRLRALEHVDAAHAVDRQEVEQRVVPRRHVERDAVHIGLDLGTRTAAAHAADEHRAAFDVAEGADRIEAGDADARRQTKRRREVDGVQVTDLLGRDGGGVAAEAIDGVAVDDRRSRDDHRRNGGRRGRCGLRERIGGEGGDAERERGEEEGTREGSFHEKDSFYGHGFGCPTLPRVAGRVRVGRDARPHGRDFAMKRSHGRT